MKYIFYKEAIKLRTPLIAAFVVNIAVAVYLYFRVRVGFVMQEPTMIWFDIIEKNAFFFDRVSMPIAVSAFVLGILQFYPEADRRRFRISCHLPVNENVTLSYMLLFGLLSIVCLWLTGTIGAMVVSCAFFPYDLQIHVPTVMAYKLMLAVTLYMIASCAALEHSWKDKLIVVLLMGGAVWFFNVLLYRPSVCYTLFAALISVISMVTLYYPALGYRAGGRA